MDQTKLDIRDQTKTQSIHKTGREWQFFSLATPVSWEPFISQFLSLHYLSSAPFAA